MAGQISDLVKVGVQLHQARQQAQDAAKATAALIHPDRLPPRQQATAAETSQNASR